MMPNTKHTNQHHSYKRMLAKMSAIASTTATVIAVCAAVAVAVAEYFGFDYETKQS